MKKSKYAKGSPFDVTVCDAIRHHIGTRTALESRRKNAFDDRDTAVAELSQLRDKYGSEAVTAKQKHSDAVLLIEDLSKQIRWHSNQVDEIVAKADEPGFEFLYEMPEDRKEKAAKRAESEQMPLGDDGGPRPVGRNTKPGRVRPETPDPSKGDGVDEHLGASVNELDLPEGPKGKLIAAGLTTVGRVQAAINDTTKDFRSVADVNENQERAIKKAVKAFLAKHLDAELKAEGIR